MSFLKILYIIFVVLANLASAGLSVLAQNDTVFQDLIDASILNEDINVDKIQSACLWISAIWSAGAVSFLTTRNTFKINKQEKQIQSFNESFRNELDERIKDVLETNANINIRLFLPKNRIKRLLFLYFDSQKFRQKIEYYFAIKNVNGLSYTGTTEKLSFCVTKRIEGLVGQAYNTGSMVFDYKLKNSNDKKYSLNPYQISKTRNLTFSVCVPITNSSGKVIAVVAYDSTNILSVNAAQREKLNCIFVSNATELYRTWPELFEL